MKNRHVKVLSDNTAAVAYVKNMGGSQSEESNAVAKRIWMWCKDRKVWLTMGHIPGKQNVETDTQSRKFNDYTEWMLNKNIFTKLTDIWKMPERDLFASRLNCQFKPFVSWHPDPEAVAIDAFTFNWGNGLKYIFPPFSMIQRTLKKLAKDQGEAIMVVPHWTTACWYPQMLQLLVDKPVLLPKGKRVLQLPHSGEPHPLHRKLQLMGCYLSGNPSRQKALMAKLATSYVTRGEIQPKNNMGHTFEDGQHSVLEEIKIPFQHL